MISHSLSFFFFFFAIFSAYFWYQWNKASQAVFIQGIWMIFLVSCKSRIHKTLFHFYHSVYMRSTHSYRGLQDFESFPIKYHNRTVFYIRLISWAKSWITSLYSIVAPELITQWKRKNVCNVEHTMLYMAIVWQFNPPFLESVIVSDIKKSCFWYEISIYVDNWYIKKEREKGGREYMNIIFLV